MYVDSLGQYDRNFSAIIIIIVIIIACFNVAQKHGLNVISRST